MKWSEAKKIINSDPEVIKELEENALEYEIKRQIIQLRLEKKLTQKKLAELIGTRQANISRLESGKHYNFSICFLNKIAKATNKKLKIEFVEV
jgi:transcriptional regulator with XRE-family HTH domain